MRIYAYGARPPVEGAEIVQQQMRLAHSYQCALVAIERRRRGAVDHLYQHACPTEHAAGEAAEKAAADAAQAVRLARSTGGEMLELDDEAKAERREILEAAVASLEAARQVAKVARQVLYDARKAVAKKSSMTFATEVVDVGDTVADLDQYAEHVKSHASIRRVHVEGHADRQERGADLLSENRAQAVLEYLVQRGVPRDRLHAAGCGARRPVAKGTKDSDCAKNRRVEILPQIVYRMRRCDRGAYARAQRAYNLAGTVGLAWGTRLKLGESVERAAKASAKEGTLPRFPRFDGGGAVSVQLQRGLDPAAALAGADTRFRLEPVDASAWMAIQGKSSLERAEIVYKNVEHQMREQERRIAQAQKFRDQCALKKDSTEKVEKAERRLEKDRRRLERLRLGTRAPAALPQAGVNCAPLAVARLRIGSNGKAPVWAAWPVVLSRPLPEGAPIKWAQVHARKVGARTEWRLLVTVDDGKSQVEVRAEGPTLAVNLGWRNLLDGGLRVAYAVDSDGCEEEVRVPPEYASGVAHVDSIRAIRDQRFEVLKKDLGEWRDEGERPEWFSESTRYLHQWKSQKHLARLLRDWFRRRFSGDEQVFSALAAWEKKDRHLRFWECDRREALLRERKEHYRVVAARWAKKYARIIVTDMDLRDFAELPAPDEGADSKDAPQRRSRFLAAPSEFRGAVKNACSTRGVSYEEVKGARMTQTCNACGIVFAFAARQDLTHTCECGARWDQDANHCRNLLASAEAMTKQAPALAPSVSEGESTVNRGAGRWQRRGSRKQVENASVVE